MGKKSLVAVEYMDGTGGFEFREAVDHSTPESKFLKRLLKESGLSLREFSNRLGLRVSEVCDIREGRVSPSRQIRRYWLAVCASTSASPEDDTDGDVSDHVRIHPLRPPEDFFRHVCGQDLPDGYDKGVTQFKGPGRPVADERARELARITMGRKAEGQEHEVGEDQYQTKGKDDE